MHNRRRMDRNVGVVTFPGLPDDKWIAGAVAVMIDEHGNYSTVFKAVSAEDLPAVEIREEVGSILGHAWQMANTSGVTS